jgi:hypothetical protein
MHEPRYRLVRNVSERPSPKTVLDHDLEKLALQDEKRRLSRVHVLADSDNGTIIGFYTLSNCQIEPTGPPLRDAGRARWRERWR